jgi:nucleotide-binding universal stress UspA family protein
VLSFTRILVDIEAAAPQHPALEQAVGLAMRCGAALTIVDVLPEVPARARDFLTPELEEELTVSRRDRLADIAGRITGVQVSTKVLRGRPATAIIQEVLRSGHDLVVRSHARDLADVPRSLGPVDMELLRQCPCPVWLIGPGGGPRLRRIAAAVHSHTDEAAERQLNATILNLALILRELGGGELTLVEAWSLFGENLLRARTPAEALAEQVEAVHRAVEADLAALVAAFGDRARGVRTVSLKGIPEDVIPAFVESEGIDVVVMGTVARTGIAGLVMGNTAERVLRRLHGNVLAVKPAGFVPPVQA